MTKETTLIDAATGDQSDAGNAPAAAPPAEPIGEQGETGEETGAAAVPEAGKAEPHPSLGAPENYDFASAGKEGVEYSAEVMSAFSAVSKELDLSQTAAQKILDRVVPVMQERHLEQIKTMTGQWRADSEKDPEFGGDKLKENMAFVARAMNRFGTPELKTLLNDSMLGDHPEIIRFFYRAGKAVSEDSIVTGQAGQSSQADARRLYAASKMNP